MFQRKQADQIAQNLQKRFSVFLADSVSGPDTQLLIAVDLRYLASRHESLLVPLLNYRLGPKDRSTLLAKKL
jgi:hypothetical protein